MRGFVTGHSTAVAHGAATWQTTDRYVAERLNSLDRAALHLNNLVPYCRWRRTLLPLRRLVQETAVSLHQAMPPELPFLFHTDGMPERARIGAVMREWLLTSRHPRRAKQLRDFLLGYQEISPLCHDELALLPIALQLAVAEKCSLLPSPENISHRYLLPRLLQSLADTCRFINRTNWKNLAATVSPIGADFR